MPFNTTLAERLQILEWSEAGEKTFRIARRLRWRASTIRKWRQRGRRLGRAGLVSHMGRPKRGALSTYPEEMRTTLLQWRQAHPGWGPSTLQVELGQQPAFAGKQLPSLARIGRFLQEQGLTKSYERHQPLPAPSPEEASGPHEVWEMDAQGYQAIPEVGKVALINLNDRASHVRLLSYPCWLGQQRVTRHPDTGDYQTALRLAFTDWGLPRCLQVDHESVFFDNKTKSPFPTLLHLWLLALGVQLRFGHPHRPTDQAMTERSHQLWQAQVIQGQLFAHWQALYHALQQRRDFLNHRLPCASLNDLPPLVACPQAHHSGRPYRPEWEREMLDLSPVYQYLARGRWFRRVADNGTISLGGTVYYLTRKWTQQQLEVTFDPPDRCFLCHNAAGQLLYCLPLQGVSVERLMGNLLPFVHFPFFQLCLPFTWEEQRVIRLFEIVDATT